MPTLVVVLCAVPTVMPLLDRLQKTENMPILTTCLVSIMRLNIRTYFLPVLALVVGFYFLEAAVVALLRKHQNADKLVWSWVIAVCCLSGVTTLVVFYSLLEELFNVTPTTL